MEAQAAAGLSHPNIVSVYDVVDEGSLHYIVMELIEGITLKSYILKKGHLGVKETIGIAIQVAQGLAAAHDQHIVHRDIKPQNMIISRDGKVKVADFGIARAVSSQTTGVNAVGSVHYISPEQAKGNYSDGRSDLYSLGITMYEMLTGNFRLTGIPRFQWHWHIWKNRCSRRAASTGGVGKPGPHYFKMYPEKAGTPLPECV